MISDFLHKCLYVLLRLVVGVILSVVLIFALTALAGSPVSDMPKEVDDQIVYMALGCALGSVVYAANSVLFDVLENLSNKFFDAIKFGLFAIIWLALIALQIYLCFPVETATYVFTGSGAWLLNGLKYSFFIAPVVGVLFAMITSKSGEVDTSDAIKTPIFITLIGVAISIIFGAIVTFIPFLSSFIHYIFILLSNGFGVFLIINGQEWPYIVTEKESRRAMNEALNLSNNYSGYGGGGNNRTRAAGSSGQLSSDMYSICQNYGGLRTFPSGHINVKITYSISGSSISFTINAKVTVDSSERDPYNIRSFKSDATSAIRGIASDVKSSAEQAVDYLRSNYTGYDKSYYVTVYTNIN